jgi:hypothetical protein
MPKQRVLTAKALHFFNAIARGWKPKKPRKKLPTQTEAMEVLGYTRVPKQKRRR